jgi:hypothetical protein
VLGLKNWAYAGRSKSKATNVAKPTSDSHFARERVGQIGTEKAPSLKNKNRR